MAVCYLVDFENVHESGLQGIDQLSANDCVFLFFTAEKDIVNLNALVGIQSALRIIRVQAGRQSLDMHLAIHLGLLIGRETSPDDQYVIISRDSDYWGIAPAGMNGMPIRTRLYNGPG